MLWQPSRFEFEDAACFRHVVIGVEGRETAPQAGSVRCERDSLRDPAEVECGVEVAVVGRQQDQGYRGSGEVPGVLAQVAQALLDCLVCDDPESPSSEELSATAAPCRTPS
jgi:hypothetical protein